MLGNTAMWRQRAGVARSTLSRLCATEKFRARMLRGDAGVGKGALAVVPAGASHGVKYLTAVLSFCGRVGERRCGLPATQQLHKLLMAPGVHRGVEPMYSVVAFLGESLGDLGFHWPANLVRRERGNHRGQSGVHDLPVPSARRF